MSSSYKLSGIYHALPYIDIDNELRKEIIALHNASNKFDAELYSVLKENDADLYNLVIDDLKRSKPKTKDAAKKILKEYAENEDTNNHTHNVLLMAQYFGTRSNIEDALLFASGVHRYGNRNDSPEFRALEKKANQWYYALKEKAGSGGSARPKKKQPNLSSYAKWEDEVTTKIEYGLDTTRSDAQSIVEAKDFEMQQAWTKGLSANETYKQIFALKKSAGAKNSKADKIAELKKKLTETAPYQDIPVSTYDGWKKELAKLMGFKYQKGDKGVYNKMEVYILDVDPHLDTVRVQERGKETSESAIAVPMGRFGKGFKKQRWKAKLTEERSATLVKAGAKGKMKSLLTKALRGDFKDAARGKVLEIAQQFQSARLKSGAARDEKSDSAKRLDPTPENLIRWMKDPGRYDLIGVDTYKKGSATANLQIDKEIWWNRLGIKFKPKN